MRAIIYAKDADDEQGENERLFHHVLSCGLALDESPLIFRKAAEEVKSDSKKKFIFTSLDRLSPSYYLFITILYGFEEKLLLQLEKILLNSNISDLLSVIMIDMILI